MAQVTLKGNPCNLAGTMPKVGDTIPDFNLTAADLSPITKASLAGKRKVVVVLPSLDTPVCQMETRQFNQRATALGDDVVVLIASADLPFAMNRFCAAEGLKNVKTGSDMRDREFGKRWGVAIADGPLAGLTARAIFVTDANDKIVYEELVPEIAQEPNYDAALSALKK